MKIIIRSHKINPKYANKDKLNYLKFPFEDFLQDISLSIINELLYSEETIKPLLDKLITDKFGQSARLNQILAKECSSIARSIRNKLNKISKNEQVNLQKYQQELLEKYKSKTLQIRSISQFNLDSRFVEIQENKNSSNFDYWIKIHWPNKEIVYIPFKKTKHIQNLIVRGYKLKTNTIRIKKNGEIELTFQKEISDISKSNIISSNSIGIDVGRNKSFITSNNETEFITKPILNSLKNQKHGSNNKASRVRKLKQIIDKEIKDNVNLTDVDVVFLEKLTGLKPNKKYGNINHHWSYRYIQNRLEQKCEEQGVLVKYIYPAYSSQECSSCGHRHKDNRSGELFKCLSCGYEIDADLNAAINIRKRGINSIHGPNKDIFI